MKHKYLSYTMALILQSIENGYRHGYDISQATGLASGTIYPALRRLEDADLIKSKWEKPSVAQSELRPARKYYEVTKVGREVLAEARGRFRLLEQMAAFDASDLKPAGEEG